MVSRKFHNSCIDKDDQLVGGFLSAMTMFAGSISNPSKCKIDNTTDHLIHDIGMGCGRWFLKNDEKFTVAIFVNNHSNLLSNSEYSLIHSLTTKILDAFNLLYLLSTGDDVNIANLFRDYSSDFAESIDNLIYETINNAKKEFVFVNA